jgi:type II secretory pathway pseudopilin PulG
MNQPPLIPPVAEPPRQKDNTALVIVLASVGAVLAMVLVIGLLAAIAIPNFIRARQTAQMSACNNNLRLIDAAKSQWALENRKSNTDLPTEGDLARYLRGAALPVCPAGGTYSLNPSDTPPTCSIPLHNSL